jgi:hypothetical protein
MWSRKIDRGGLELQMDFLPGCDETGKSDRVSFDSLSPSPYFFFAGTGASTLASSRRPTQTLKRTGRPRRLVRASKMVARRGRGSPWEVPRRSATNVSLCLPCGDKQHLTSVSDSPLHDPEPQVTIPVSKEVSKLYLLLCAC